jgi:hypothetical protein
MTIQNPSRGSGALVFAALAALVCSSPAIASDGDVCVQLDAHVGELNAKAGTEMVQHIRGIYTIHGLAFNDNPTHEQCVAAWAALDEAGFDPELPDGGWSRAKDR